MGDGSRRAEGNGGGAKGPDAEGPPGEARGKRGHGPCTDMDGSGPSGDGKDPVAGEGSGREGSMSRIPPEGEDRLSNSDRVRLSKAMSLRLRHRPGHFDLTLDAQGFVGIEELVQSLTQWKRWVDSGRVLEVVRRCDKGRFEVRGDRVRCVYGHSFEQPRIVYPSSEPPAILHHGTPRRVLDRILAEGLRPMGRQYVHLSTDPAVAVQVGQRRAGEAVILRVRAGEAHRDGVPFYVASPLVILADHVPPEYLDLPSGPGSSDPD